jgi:hypothetical protein
VIHSDVKRVGDFILSTLATASGLYYRENENRAVSTENGTAGAIKIVPASNRTSGA